MLLAGRLLLALLFLGISNGTSVSAQRRVTLPELRVELLRLSREDEAARQLLLARPQDRAAQTRVQGVDRYNTRRLKAIVAQYGWPGRSAVGEDGADAAWLLLQHADHDRRFQLSCLKLMEPLLKTKEIRKEDFAFLTDRVLVADGRKQRYGTQFKLDGPRIEPYPIEDLAGVDRRRKELGLGPLADYRRQLEELYAPAISPSGDRG